MSEVEGLVSAMSAEEPPFEEDVAHLDLLESHYLEKQLSENWERFSKADRNIIISLIRDLIDSNGIRRTLTQVSAHIHLRQYAVTEQEFDSTSPNPRDFDISPEEDPGLPPRLLQYAVGIALTTTEGQSEAHSFKEIAKPLLELLIWHQKKSSQYTARTTSAREYITVRGADSLAARELTMLRHADGRQMHEKAYRLYKPWESELESILGFSIEDALYYQNLLADYAVEKFEEYAREEVQYTDSLLKLGEPVLDIADDNIWLTRDELVDICDDTDRFHAFLDRMTANPGEVTEYNHPTDVNPLQIEPFPRVDGEYMLPLPRTVQYALANTFYFDLINSHHSGEFGDSIGQIIEEWAVECLHRIFQPESVYESVEYPIEGGMAESDIVVSYEGTLLIIECKGKRLTAETRRGEFGGTSSLDTIRDDVEASIGNATNQAERLATRIESGEIKQMTTSDGQTLDLSSRNIERCYRMVVLGESYGSIATREYAGILELDTLPYVCDIYDLQVLTATLDAPRALLRYIQKRIHMTKVQTYYTQNRVTPPSGQYPNQKTFSTDEIDYLGVYHRNGNQFPPGAQYIVGAGDQLREDTITDLYKQDELKYTY